MYGKRFKRAGYDCNYHVEVRLHTQSPDIAGAVDGDTLGAGDQGIMYGYACWETVELLPAPVVLANRITSLLTTCREEKLISGIGPDGKAQVSVQYAFGVPERVDTIVISCQHDADKDPDELREELRRLVIDRACHDVRIDEQTKIFINPSGRFVLGGFEADTGLTGRKLMVDTYGGLVPPRRRCAFRQGRHEGRPQRRIYGAICGKEHCRSRSCRCVYGQPRLCHWAGRAGCRRDRHAGERIL